MASDSLATIVDAGIDVLADALAKEALTSVDLVAKYLLRIAAYDTRDTALNSIPLINENVFNEAAAADDRRKAGKARGRLDGIPFTVKDSYKVQGMTVASGSEAFEHLIANEDAFIVAALRDAGAVVLGKTNMCPMAYGGMLRGVYGRAESPYNQAYLPAAFGSGSSNGSAVSVAASFAAFGFGGETVSSGRSPASNNALVAYTPSKGLISVRGTWPLYPTCDVIAFHTRNIDDLLALLDVVAVPDPTTTGDFFRDQPFIQIPAATWNPPKSYTTIQTEDGLLNKRIAVPKMYLTQVENGPYVSDTIKPLWRQAKADLEAKGAIVEEVTEFPIIHVYETALSKSGDRSLSSPEIPEDWNSIERGMLIAHAWEDFLQDNKDSSIPSLVGVEPAKLFPQMSRDDPQVKFTEPANAVQWSNLAKYVENRPESTRPGKSCVYDIPQLDAAVVALEAMRKQWFENWMDEHNFDFVIFPAAGDVAKSDADVDSNSAEHAWTNGVKYSHGNRAIRHLGIPGVTVPMGNLQPQNMPMGLTFLGRAYDDVRILQAGHTFEQKAQRRVLPPLTPPLSTDHIPSPKTRSRSRPKLSVQVRAVPNAHTDDISLTIEGIIGGNGVPTKQDNSGSNTIIDIFVDGKPVAKSDIVFEQSDTQTDSRESRFTCKCLTSTPPRRDRRSQVVGKVARDSTMVMMIARHGEDGWPAGFLKLIHISDVQQ